jgi:hypothetical protein
MNRSSVKYVGPFPFSEVIFRRFGRRALRGAEAVETGERFKIERPVLLLGGHAALFGCAREFSMG